MSMNKNLDNFFRKKLDSYSSEVPPEMWGAIAEKRKKRALGFLFLRPLGVIAALIAGFSLLSVFYWSGYEEGVQQEQEFGIVSMDRKTEIVEPEMEYSKETPNLANVENKTIEEVQESSSTKVESPQVNRQLSSAQIDRNRKEFLKKRVDLLKDSGENSSENSEQSKTIELKDKSAQFSLETNEDYLFQKEEKEIDRTADSEGARNDENDEEESLALGFAQFNKLDNDLFLNSNVDHFKNWSPLSCPSFNFMPPFQVFIEAVGGPELAFRSLEQSKGEPSSYGFFRDSTEQALTSYSGGVRVAVLSSQGMIVKAGLQYTQINEQFDYRNEGESQMVVESVFNESGELIRTDTAFVSGTVVKTTYNKFRFIDLPLTLGYEWSQKGWSVGINATAYLNLRFSQEGSILSPELEPVSISSDDNERFEAFKGDVGWSFGLSSLFAYDLSPRFQLIAEPHIRFFTKSVTKKTYPLDQRYTSTGLWFGLRYKI